MDPTFIMELFAEKTARNDHAAIDADLTPDQREKKAKAAITKRKVQIMKRREQQRNGRS